MWPNNEWKIGCTQNLHDIIPLHRRLHGYIPDKILVYKSENYKELKKNMLQKYKEYLIPNTRQFFTLSEQHIMMEMNDNFEIINSTSFE